MAQLPGIPLRPQAGQSPSLNVVEPTDLGLGAAAQNMGAWQREREKTQLLQEEVQAKADDRAAEPLIEPVASGFERRFQEAAARYDGQTPGFARSTLEAFEAEAKPLLERQDLAPGVAAAARRRLDKLRTQVGQRAISFEGQRAGARVAEAEAARKAADLSTEVVGFQARLAPRMQALLNGYDGSQGGLAGQVLEAFDAEADAAIEAAPEELKAQVQERLASLRLQRHATALDVEQRGAETYVAASVKQTAATWLNAVRSDPSLIDAADGEIEAMLAPLPADKRLEVRPLLRANAAEARIEGLIDAGQIDQAKDELNGGRWDGWLMGGDKDRLLARAVAKADDGPKTEAEWTAKLDYMDRAQAEVDARRRGQSTGLSLQEAVNAFLSPAERAALKMKFADADRFYSATGDVRAQTSESLRQRAGASPPDPTAPDYANRLESWQASATAARDELAEREKDPVAWAMTSRRKDDAGAVLQGQWRAVTEASDAQAMGFAGRKYALTALGLQHRAGIQPSAQRVFPKSQAAALAASFAKATPEARPQALANLQMIVSAMPASVPIGDGTTVSARQMAVRELKDAGLGPADVSAIVDLDEHPGRLALYSDAISNPDARKALANKGDESALEHAIEGRLANYIETANTLPSHAELNAGRRARALIMGRHFMLEQGLSPVQAAKKATEELAEDYRFVDGYRVPARVAEGVSGGAPVRERIRTGAREAIRDLIARDGALLAPAPAGAADPLGEAGRRRKMADTVLHAARWVTTEDDNGLRLMVPDARGWTPVKDKAGRPVALSWEQLKARGQADARPGAWLAPPPAAAAVRAPPQKAHQAFAAAIEHQESGGNTLAESPKGAAGVRQIMPATARTQAGRMGLAHLFAGKTDAQVKAALKADAAMNRRLSDGYIGFLAHRYDGNIALVAAAYNAGEGMVDDWIDGANRTGKNPRRVHLGDPRRGLVSADAWVAGVPFDETRDYVRKVLPRALANLNG